MILKRLWTQDIKVYPDVNGAWVTLSTNGMVSVSKEYGESLKSLYGATNFEQVQDINANFSVITP